NTVASGRRTESGEGSAPDGAEPSPAPPAGGAAPRPPLLHRQVVLLHAPRSTGRGRSSLLQLQRQREQLDAPCSSGRGNCTPLPGELPRPPSSRNLAKFRGPGGPNKSLLTHLRPRLVVPPWPRCFARCGWWR